ERRLGAAHRGDARRRELRTNPPGRVRGLQRGPDARAHRADPHAAGLRDELADHPRRRRNPPHRVAAPSLMNPAPVVGAGCPAWSSPSHRKESRMIRRLLLLVSTLILAAPAVAQTSIELRSSSVV